MKTRYCVTEWVLLLALTVMWGSAFMLTKIALSALSPTVVVAGRLALGSALLVSLAALKSQRLPTGGRLWLFYVGIAFFGNALPFSLITWGQGYIDSGLAGILMAVMPLVVLGLAHYLVPGERVTVYRAGGFLLGFAGIMVLMGPDALSELGGEKGQLMPMMAVLGGAISYAVAVVLARLRPVSGALSTAAATTLIATLLMLPVVIQGVDFTHLPEPTTAVLLAVVLLGVFSTAIATVIYFWLINRAGPAFVSQINYLIPLWAVAIGVLFLGEAVERSHLYSLALVLGGIFLTQLERRRTAPAKGMTREVTSNTPRSAQQADDCHA